MMGWETLQNKCDYLMTQALEFKYVYVSSALEDPLILCATIICGLADPELGSA